MGSRQGNARVNLRSNGSSWAVTEAAMPLDKLQRIGERPIFRWAAAASAALHGAQQRHVRIFGQLTDDSLSMHPQGQRPALHL